MAKNAKGDKTMTTLHLKDIENRVTAKSRIKIYDKDPSAQKIPWKLGFFIGLTGNR
ncbi:hypothetical protein [Salibacterium halotolerans]|uniref:Uncharacterized protein n=1 Tax=Salibacterium halotolerans TaxID=1884432 RepID=A0A1I5PPK2_9BACI|nr:hypothetical protein [Salibacterium halotolerans]SFP35939.1 hypothetical protein SAMN05518683_104187 [Salibacterium halotolerans]